MFSSVNRHAERMVCLLAFGTQVKCLAAIFVRHPRAPPVQSKNPSVRTAQWQCGAKHYSFDRSAYRIGYEEWQSEKELYRVTMGLNVTQHFGFDVECASMLTAYWQQEIGHRCQPLIRLKVGIMIAVGGLTLIHNIKTL